MVPRNLFIQTILLVFLALGNSYAQGGQVYTLDKSIQVYDLNTGKTKTLRPRDGLRFEITGSVGGSYRLKITDSKGNIMSGDFISARRNIDNGFVLAKVVEQFDDVVSAINDLDNCDQCDHQRDMAQDQKSLESDSCNIPGTDEEWKIKCLQLYKKGIPRGALDYALKAMKLNATSFRTSKCFDNSGLKDDEHPSMDGLTGSKLRNELLRNGLPNKCQMIINDVEARLSSCRATMYYIDLCSGKNVIVRDDYHNIGEGTCKLGDGYRNFPGSKSTLKGVFFTHNKTFDYANVTTDESYEDVRKLVSRAGGSLEATAVSLFGLQRTNNLASKNEHYLHASKEWSSKGSVSVAPENFYMIEAMAENGPSMVVNWARSGMEPLEACSE